MKMFEEFINDNNKLYDSFTINVKYEVGYCDIDPKNILTSALQKKYKGWEKTIFLDTWGFNYTVKNSDIELKLIDSTYDNETYEVIYNKNRDKYDEFDNENDIFELVLESIKRITHYTYRSEYSMDKVQKSDIKILTIDRLGI